MVGSEVRSPMQSSPSPQETRRSKGRQQELTLTAEALEVAATATAECVDRWMDGGNPEEPEEITSPLRLAQVTVRSLSFFHTTSPPASSEVRIIGPHREGPEAGRSLSVSYHETDDQEGGGGSPGGKGL